MNQQANPPRNEAQKEKQARLQEALRANLKRRKTASGSKKAKATTREQTS